MKRKRQSIGVKINPVDLMHTAAKQKALTLQLEMTFIVKKVCRS